MSILFLFLNSFFSKNKKILVLLLVIILGSSIYFISRLKLEEDIAKTNKTSNEKVNLVLKQSKLTNKFILNIFLTDSTTTEDPNQLISYSKALFDSLNGPNLKPFISDITYKIDERVMNKLLDVFVDYLPIFLNDNDYQAIDSLILDKNIEKSLDKNYKSLMSPSGLVLKKFILQDPVGITTLGFNKLKQLQFDNNYEIQDGYIFTKDRKHLFIFINPAFSASQTSQNSIFIDKLDNVIQNITAKSNQKVTTEYFGGAAVAAGNAKQIKRDVILTVLISLIIILVFVAWFFKRISIPFLSFLPAVFGGAIALAILYLIRSSVSVIALAIGSVLLGIIVDYSLYIFSLYRTKGSFELVLKDLSITIMLCSLTSATAFFTLMFLQSEVLRDLGLFTGLSILGAAIFSLIVLPHTLNAKDKLGNSANRITIIDKVANYSFESNRVLVSIFLVVTIFFLFTAREPAFETDMYKMNFTSEKLQRAENHLNKINLKASNSIFVVSSGKDLNEALANDQRAFLKLVELKSNHIINDYSCASSILINDSIQKIRILKWNSYWTKDKKNKLKNSLISGGKKFGFNDDAFSKFFFLLYKKYFSTPRDVSNKIKETLFSDRIIESGNSTMIVSLIKAENEKRNEVFSSFVQNKGNSISFDKQEITTGFIKNIKVDFELLVNLCLILVTLVLIISFGRIEIGLIAAMPMFISWSWTLGIMGLLGLKFNIFNIIVTTLIFGLGVDYSILMIQGLLLEYRTGQKELKSYKTSIFLSATTTIVGVGVLILAKHPALNSMALISIIGLLSVVLVSYTLEPLFFKFLTTNKSKKRKLPITFTDIIFTILAFTLFLTGCLLLNVFLLLVLLLPINNKNKKYIMHVLMKFLCKFEIYAMFNVKKRIINEPGDDFKKPSIILANHQSHIDLLFLLMLYPKIIVITNHWVWNNPIYSFVIRFMDFYNISEGHEHLIDKLKVKINDGYSILIFPEGSRSEDCKIKRFHKGAFLLAEQLNLDILPIIIHGLGDCMTKGENYLKNGTITMKICRRIVPQDNNFGTDYSKKTKLVLKYFRNEYDGIIEKYETPRYYKSKLVKNYIYKGPILEWYTRVKLRLEKEYVLFDKLILRDADIVDIGCGYGFLAYLLHFVSEKRKVTGIDYDKDKILIANNCISKDESIHFIAADALDYQYSPKDVFILNDVLHYLTEELQEQLITTCIENLKDNGLIIIRDADSNLKKRHLGTLYTEFFSTKFGFNKMNGKKLSYTTSLKINHIAKINNMKIEMIDESSFTSNIVYLLRKL